jgi:hypothetical protein
MFYLLAYNAMKCGKVNRRFGGIYHFYRQGRKDQARNQREAGEKLSNENGGVCVSDTLVDFH